LHRVRALVVATARVSFRVDLQEPDLILERSALISFLADRAKDAGAQIHYGCRFKSLEPAPQGVQVCFQGPGRKPISISARAVIGADGVLSDVATALGVEHAPTVPILQAEVKLPSNWDPAVTQVWFDTDDTRFFYWLIPESAEYGVVGLVGDDRARMGTLLRRFLDRHRLQPLAYQGARIAMHHPRLQPGGRLGSARVLLVGDAAGQVKVTTVGGTVTGIQGASAAVRALLHGTSYRDELRSLKRELDLHWFLRLMLDRLDNASYDGLASSVTPRVQRFLSDHNRDEMASAFWKLPLLQPRLIALGMNSLLPRHSRAMAFRRRRVASPE
jgi:flavin-dependent dehydrogenase